jgi:outer membrane protein TolC
MYQETVDQYRATVLNDFREVVNGLSLTRLLTTEAQHQDEAVAAVMKARILRQALFKSGSGPSLELIYAHIGTPQARIDAVLVKTGLLRAEVALVRALGWLAPEATAHG